MEALDIAPLVAELAKAALFDDCSILVKRNHKVAVGQVVNYMSMSQHNMQTIETSKKVRTSMRGKDYSRAVSMKKTILAENTAEDRPLGGLIEAAKHIIEDGYWLP